MYINWTKVMAKGTCVMALGTLLYFAVMVRTVNKMRESNALSRESLELTRRNLELQYRPAIYLDKISLGIHHHPDSVVLGFRLKNYGRVAVKDVVHAVDITENRERYLIFYPSESPPIKGICPPQGEITTTKAVFRKDLKRGLFAHIFVNYTGVSELSGSKRDYYTLLGNMRITTIDDRELNWAHLDWEEYPKCPSLSVVDSIHLYYKERGLGMECFKENRKIKY